MLCDRCPEPGYLMTVAIGDRAEIPAYVRNFRKLLVYQFRELNKIAC